MKPCDLYKESRKDSVKSLEKENEVIQVRYYKEVETALKYAKKFRLSVFVNVLLFILLIISFASCQTAKQWNKKGFERGWIDTATVTVYDTIHFKGSVRDTLFMSSNDTIFLRDSMFVTKYFYNTITKQNYVQTDVKPQERIVTKEIHTTTLKELKYSFADHLKAVWYVWLGLFVLLCIIALIALFRK